MDNVEPNSRRELLARSYEIANDFLDGLKDRPVGLPVEFDVLLAEMGGAAPCRRGRCPPRHRTAL